MAAALRKRHLWEDLGSRQWNALRLAAEAACSQSIRQMFRWKPSKPYTDADADDDDDDDDDYGSSEVDTAVLTRC